MDNGTDVDHYYVYPHGAYLYWAQDSTTKAWLHYGDSVQMYWHTRDGSGVLWDFVEVTGSGSPTFTPASDGAGAGGGCDSDHPEDCTPCQNGGTCGWIPSFRVWLSSERPDRFDEACYQSLRDRKVFLENLHNVMVVDDDSIRNADAVDRI